MTLQSPFNSWLGNFHQQVIVGNEAYNYAMTIASMWITAV